jgi:hypothetical protein
MINIDSRLFDTVTADQLWLLCQIIKRADANLACYPSNKTLCVDTGWNIKKLQRVKSELIECGLLVVKARATGTEKQTSNWYVVQTEFIAVYVPAKNLSVLIQDTPKKDTLSEKRTAPPTPKTDNEVLTNSEVLIPSTKVDVPKSAFEKAIEETAERSQEPPQVEPGTNNTSGAPGGKTERPKRVDDKAKNPEFKEFIAIWHATYPLLLDMRRGLDGG